MIAKKKPMEIKKKIKEVATEPKEARKKSPAEPLRGFRDVLPDEQGNWNTVRDTARKLAESYSFDRIDLPLLESADLFIRTVGRGTDIVEKEMYMFEAPGGEKVALRPEATASVARAYINHGMLNLPQPVKFWYMGPMFRHDRPQAGRYRQFNQFGFESVGADDPIIDAQLIVIANSFFTDIGIPVNIHVNSLGNAESRQRYKVELVAYYRTHRNQICEDCKVRLTKNPLRLLDCKAEQCQAVKEEAPQILDWIDEESKAHFMRVLEYLDDVEVHYTLDSRLVRGLDYYNRTVFEIMPAAAAEEGKAQSAFGGGGRYDGLVELLGGRPTPACGFAIGMERVVMALREAGIPPKTNKNQIIFFAQLGEAARKKGLKLFEEFRGAGICVTEAFGKGSLKAQLELANSLKAVYTLILGQKEVLDGTIIIRDMDSGEQEVVDAMKVVSLVSKKLSDREKFDKI